MAGTTTNFAIPYPSSTDYVTDGATAMRSLAEQVDGVLFTGSSSGNLLINGAMQVAQRGTSTASITTSNYYTADRWKYAISSLGTWTQTVENDAPTGSGFRKSMKYLCATADATPSAGDLAIHHQILEGQNLQAIRKGTASAQQVTVSFWVKSNKTGTYVVDIYDEDNSRGCSKSYTINVSNTWEYKSLLFPADTTGAFDNDANASAHFRWWLGAGSSYQTAPLQTEWAASGASVAAGQVNVADEINNFWQITGCQVTVGAVDVPFEFKSFGEELEQCQRYCISRKTDYTVFNGFTTTNGQKWTTAHLPTTMRASPTFTAFDGVGNASRVSTLDSAGTSTSNVAISFQQSFPTLVYVLVSGTHTGFFYSYFVECEL